MPRLPRRALLAAAAATLPFAHLAAQARPLRVVIPFGPGGGTDNLARVIDPRVAQLLGQTLLIENRPGAASTVGTDIVAKAEADGQTVLMTDSTFPINTALLPSMPYDSVKDFAPVSLLASGPIILVAHPSLPANTLQEFVALAKARPGQFSYASGGNGSGPHLAGELLKMEAGIQLQHIPYRGSGPAMNDLVGGHVSVGFNGISASGPHIASGRLKALAVTGATRAPSLPNVPTFAEAGLAGVEASSYWGVLVRAGTAPARIGQLSQAFAEAVKTPELQARLVQLGYVTMGTDAAGYAANLASEMAKWARIIRAANIQPD